MPFEFIKEFEIVDKQDGIKRTRNYTKEDANTIRNRFTKVEDEVKEFMEAMREINHD